MKPSVRTSAWSSTGGARAVAGPGGDALGRNAGTPAAGDAVGHADGVPARPRPHHPRNSFRRLKHKTQVFIAPTGDHYVTRLTHTLEVAQIARTIARALNLNEDLTEAIGLGHDLGHTPFGHAGEQALGELLPEGFRHNEQSVRIIDLLEQSGAGLNLTWEVREGILKHSKPREGIFEELDERYWSPEEWGEPLASTLEAQIVRLADSVAYLNHDIADATRAGLLKMEDLPAHARNVLGDTHSQRIDTLVSDIVDASWDAAQASPANGPLPPIVMSAEVTEAADELREYMFENVYLWEERLAEAARARRVIEFLGSGFSHTLRKSHLRSTRARKMPSRGGWRTISPA